MKHLIFLSLALLMCANSATAAENPSGTCGTNCNWTIEDGVLQIFGKENGKMDDYIYGKNFDTPWLKYKEEIKTIKVTDLDTIGLNAFLGLTNVKNADISDGLKTISGSSFHNNDLEAIIVPDSVTYIGINAFAGNDRLKSIIIPDSIVSIEYGGFNIPSQTAVICKGKCEEIRKILTESGYSGKLYLADSTQCTGSNYYWTGGMCNNRPTDGSMIECDEGWYVTNKDVCEKIKLRYTLPEADELTSDDNENMIEWIFE